MRKVPYPHPGEILLEEFLKPMQITQYRLAKEIAVPQRRIGEIVAGKRAVTADTGLRLSRFFGMSDAFWIGLQMDYDARSITFTKQCSVPPCPQTAVQSTGFTSYPSPSQAPRAAAFSRG